MLAKASSDSGKPMIIALLAALVASADLNRATRSPPPDTRDL